jgi:hypothetical protein
VEAHQSARRHGVADVDINHAIDHALVVVDVDADSDPPKILVIDPDRAGNLLEVMVLELADERFPPSTPCPSDRHSTTCSRKRRTPMADGKPHTTKTGRVLSDAEIESLADEAEGGYDVEELKQRRRGRPLLGSAPAEVVPVRLDPDLKRAVEARAEAEHTTLSEVIREALRQFLDVA